MDWEKWREGKTEEEVEAEFEKLEVDLQSLKEMIAYEKMRRHTKKFRPDLWKEFINLENEFISILDSTVLTDKEKELKTDETFIRFNSIMDETISDMKMRKRPVS